MYIYIGDVEELVDGEDHTAELERVSRSCLPVNDTETKFDHTKVLVHTGTSEERDSDNDVRSVSSFERSSRTERSISRDSCVSSS